MRWIVKLLIFAIFTLWNISCVNKEEAELKAKLTSSLNRPIPSKDWKNSDVQRFVEIELQCNRKYIANVKQSLESSFEDRLAIFEDNELGFFSSFGHMFQVLFWDDTKLNDVWAVKASKYFNTLEVKTAIYQCYEDYAKDLSALRSNFVQTPLANLPKFANLDLPQEKIYLGALESHAKNNWVIELGVEALVWIMILAIVAIISVFVAVPTGGLSLIVSVITIIISVILSIRNDNRLLDDLRKQNTAKVEIDYDSILKNLDKNTYEFYEKQ